MAFMGATFQPGQMDTENKFAAIPAGWYKAMVMESDVKDNKSNTGQYVKFVFEVMEGQYANRKIWTYINFQHKNPDAAAIGQRDLGALAKAAGILSDFSDTNQLHAIPVEIKVAVKLAEGIYDEGNVIKDYRPATGQATYGVAPVPQPAAPPYHLLPPPQPAPQTAWGAASQANTAPPPQPVQSIEQDEIPF